MTGVICLRDLKAQVRGLVGWSIGVVVTVGIMGLFWPSIRDMPDLSSFIEAYPEEMRRLFQIEAMTTGAGYLNVELFSIMLPIIFLIFGIARGARLLAGEEEAGTLEVLASVSVPRARILLEKTAVLVAAVGVLTAVTFISTLATSRLFEMGVPAGEALVGAVAVGLLGIEAGLLALALGAIGGRRSLALVVTSTLAVAAYLLQVAAIFLEQVEPWVILSPFHQALAGGPLGGGWRASFVWMPLAGLTAVLIAWGIFQRRDVRT